MSTFIPENADDICAQYVKQVEEFFRQVGANEKSRSLLLADVGNRFPVPKELGGIRPSTLLRTCGHFMVEASYKQGMMSGQQVWLCEGQHEEEEEAIIDSSSTDDGGGLVHDYSSGGAKDGDEDDDGGCCTGPCQAPR